jgi:sugar-specific transcriptional regulator TrmB
MPHSLHFPILQELGLSETESLIYELLLESGTTPAKDLVNVSGMGRGNVYNVLMQLQAKGLVLVIEGKKQQFQAVDPSNLRTLLKTKLYEAERLNASFEQTLPLLTSAFNLSTGKPAIQIFEGIEGSRQALYESLNSKTEILTYFDVGSFTGPAININIDYVKKRIAKKIPKRLIVANTKQAHAFFDEQNTPYTQVAFLHAYPERHASAMEIYDNTISYLTLTDEKRISVLIQDPHIYRMHVEQFNYLWKQAEEIIDYAARDIAIESKGSKAA